MVYTERGEMAAVSRGTSHVTTKQRCKYTTSVDIHNALHKKLQKKIYKKLQLQKVETAVLGFPSLIVLMVSADVKQH